MQHFENLGQFLIVRDSDVHDGTRPFLCEDGNCVNGAVRYHVNLPFQIPQHGYAECHSFDHTG